MKPESLPNTSKFTAFARRLVPALVAVVFVGIAACGDDDDPIIDIPEDFDLTFSGDDSFVGPDAPGGPHGGQTLFVVVEHEDGTEVASDDVVLPATLEAGGQAFSFTFTDVLDEDETYVIKYVIDSNFGGGTEGTCDPPENDHQWEITSTDVAALASVSADVTHEDSHRLDDVSATDLCDSFDFGTA